MSTPISAEEFAKAAREEGPKFDIQGTVFPKSGGSFFGHGTIERKAGGFLLLLTFAVGAEAPEAPGGTYDRNDFWRFEGVIGADLRCVIEHLGPCGTRHWNNGITSQEYDANTVSLLPLGFDELNVSDLLKLYEHVQSENDARLGKPPKDPAVEASTPPAKELDDERERPNPHANGTWIHALVIDFPLIHFNGRTDSTEKNDFLGKSHKWTKDTFSGNFEGVEYGLVQRCGDLNIYLFLRAGEFAHVIAALAGKCFAVAPDFSNDFVFGHWLRPPSIQRVCR